jgi:hypothetical protein
MAQAVGALLLGRGSVVWEHARAYWHEAGHVLVARKLDVPVQAVIYTNLKRLPDRQVSGGLVTVYYFTRESNPVRRAKQEAEWVRQFGVERVCTLTAGGTAAEEIYSPPAELGLDDQELIKFRSNGAYTMQDLLPRARQILIDNPEALRALASRLIENGRRVFAEVPLKAVLPLYEFVLTKAEIDNIVR